MMPGIMTHKDFRLWRKSLKLSQKEAAEALGLKRRVVQYYEKGERDGEKVEVPKAVRLACFALSAGVADYRGPGHPHQAFIAHPLAEEEGFLAAPSSVSAALNDDALVDS
jgi:transcriptional regulator with XRE-family HTH domain